MAVEQVMEIRVEIERVMDERGDSSEELLQSLTALENVDVDLEILEATMIGKVVNALRKSNEERISKAAKNLLKRWKALVKSPTGSASEMKTVYSESSSVSKRKASDNREESFNHSKKAKESESDENLSSCSALRAPLTFTAKDAKTMDGFRDKIIAIFDKSLGDDLFPTPNDRLYCAFLIEKGLFERFQETSKLYKDKYRDIAFALKDTRNSDLNQKLASGEIPPEAVAHLTAEQMASENQLKELHAKKMEMRDARRSDWQAEHGQFTDMFKCGRCKQHKCTYTQLQTRGADEPMTTFVNCANCGNRWKF